MLLLYPLFPQNYPQDLLVSFVMCLYGNQDELCKKGKKLLLIPDHLHLHPIPIDLQFQVVGIKSAYV